MGASGFHAGCEGRDARTAGRRRAAERAPHVPGPPRRRGTVAAMSESTTLHVVTVFLGEGDTGGNELGVFLGAPGLPDRTRRKIAADLGLAETVFVEDPARARVHIHPPAVELPLAGHPLVGTSWLLARESAPVGVLNPPAGQVPTWSDGDRVWIRADPDLAPVFETRRLASPADVDALDGGEEGVDLHVWAWLDEAVGAVRVRVFPGGMGIAEDEAPGAGALRVGQLLGRGLSVHAGDGGGEGVALDVWAWLDEAVGAGRVRVFPGGMGIAEDEATGAAALRLGQLLGRALTVHQGRGSRIDVRPGEAGTVEVGGRC